MTTAMQDTLVSDSAQQDLQQQLKQALAELAELRTRVAGLEKLAVNASPASPPAAVSAPAKQPVSKVEKGITEEEVLAISAAIAAWLGLHAHIRQIRLIRSAAWAQQGRVTIQASHSLHH